MKPTFKKRMKKMFLLLWMYDAKAILGVGVVCSWLGLSSFLHNDIALMKYMIILNSVLLSVVTAMFVCADSLREYFKEFSFGEQRRYNDLFFTAMRANYATEYDKETVRATLENNKHNKDAWFASMEHFHFGE